MSLPRPNPDSPIFYPDLVEDINPQFLMDAERRAHPEIDFDAPMSLESGRFAGWGADHRWRVLLRSGQVVEGPSGGAHLVAVTSDGCGRPYAQTPIHGGMRKGMPISVTLTGDQPWIATVMEDRLLTFWRVIRHHLWQWGWHPSLRKSPTA